MNRFTTRNPVIESGFIGSLAWNGEKFLTNLRKENDRYFFKGKEVSLQGNDLGGILTFPTDINDEKIETINAHLSQKKEFLTYSTGYLFKKRYSDKNYTPAFTTFDELSFSVEIIGIKFDLLLSMASELCREVKRKSVLVKENGSGRILVLKVT